MSDIFLAKEADAFICILYKYYLEKRKNGSTLENSKYIGDDIYIRSSLTPKLLLADVTELCWSLERHGLVHTTLGDNRANDVTFTDSGIAYMETRFSNKLGATLDYLKKIKDLIPFI